MDGRALAWLWFLLQISTKATSSLSLKPNNGYGNKEITKNFNPAVPTERTESPTSTHSLKHAYKKPVSNQHRFYRQADLEASSIQSTGVTESITPLTVDELTEKYESPSTTESNFIDKTVIPLKTTAQYDAIETLRSETTKRETVTPSIPTEKDSTVDTSKYITENYSTTKAIKHKDEERYVKRTSNFTHEAESAVTSNQWLNESENDTIKAVTVLPVLGIDTKRTDSNGVLKIDKQQERIMTLPPLREEKYSQLKETVRNMVEEAMLKKETESFVIQLHRKYEELPLTEADNSIWRKYARAVAETFVLDFCRNYPHYVASKAVTQWDADEYTHIFNTTLKYLQKKKTLTAVQLAVPVRRAADIFKAILDTPIGIVQSRCRSNMPKWLCFAEYVVRLADISDTCEHIWYHAQAHLMVLQTLRHAKGPKDPANEIIDELNRKLSEVGSNNDVNYLFDFIIHTLGDLGKKLKSALLLQVSQFNLIRELQSEDKLKCLNIDQVL